RTLQVVSPGPEGLKDSKQLLIVGVIVEFQCRQCSGVKGDRAKLVVFTGNGQYAGDGIVRGIGFHCELSTGNEVSKDRSGGESFFEHIEGQSALLGEVPGYVFSCEVGQGDDDVQVVVDEASEGLDVLDLPGLGPVADGFDLFTGHGEAGQRKAVA
ncbi:hypothetical protein M404DRAFT_130420, partial [Pisolithus tinctorius Marx 270]